jgi:hypothetical protein
MDLNDRRTTRACLALCVPLLLGACGRVPGQFIIVQDQVPMGGGCSITTNQTVYNPSGILDVAVVNQTATSGYLVFPLLQNDLPPPSGSLVDGNRIALTAFDVDLHMTAVDPPAVTGPMFATLEGAQDPQVHYSLPTSGSVASGGGLTAAIVEGFPTSLAIAIAKNGDLGGGVFVDVNIKVRAHGERLTGSIVSDDFNFPIKLCSGCLISSVQPCPVKTAPPLQGNPCNPAQDELVDCCTVGGTLYCPSLVSQ